MHPTPTFLARAATRPLTGPKILPKAGLNSKPKAASTPSLRACFSSTPSQQQARNRVYSA